MIELVFLLALGFQSTADIAPLPDRNYQKDGGKISDDHLLFYTTSQYIHGWNTAFEKVVDIRVTDGKIDAYTVVDQHIFASLYDRAAGLTTRVFDYQGNTLGELPLFASQFRKLNNQVYIFRQNLEPPHLPAPYPFVFQPIQLEKTADGYTFQDHGMPLFKFTPHLAKFGFDFKDTWGVYKNDTYYFVNEIEPKVWIVTPERALMEKKVGARQPGNVPFEPLHLKQFRPILTPFSPPKGIYTSEEIQDIRWRWWMEGSQIVGFQAYGDGFLVAYEYPQCDDAGNCEESLLGLQKFDQDFQPIGEPITLPGLLLGTIGAKAYILQFDEPLTPTPPVGPYGARILVLDAL